MLTEITVGNKKMFFVCLYRSPSQNFDQLSDFYKDFSVLLNNINEHRPPYPVIVGDFNAKCSKQYPLDKNNGAGEALQTYTTTTSYSQLINKPTHSANGSLSCMDLILTHDANLGKLGI